MIDVHCHLNFKSFANDVNRVIQRARDKGITRIINVGTKLDSSQLAVDLAEKHEDLFAIVGVHPHHADKIEENWVEKLEMIAKHPKVLAIGEIGMDYYRYASNGIVDPKKQREVFEAQIILAHKLNLPLQIHNRHAGKDTIEILDQYKDKLQTVPGMFHCMSGDLDHLKAVLDREFYVGFDGNITYDGIAPGETVALSELVKTAPLERIVIETDSPYLMPEPHRGKRNEPSYAIITAQFIADLKHISLEKVIEQTTENSYTVFAKLK